MQFISFLYFTVIVCIGLKITGATIHFEPAYLMGTEISCSWWLQLSCFLYSWDLLHSFNTNYHPVPNRISKTCDSKKRHVSSWVDFEGCSRSFKPHMELRLGILVSKVVFLMLLSESSFLSFLCIFWQQRKQCVKSWRRCPLKII